MDPRELTEADDFFGTAALKSYTTFVRPRPKQLQKVTVRAGPGRAGTESVAGAANVDLSLLPLLLLLLPLLLIHSSFLVF